MRSFLYLLSAFFLCTLYAQDQNPGTVPKNFTNADIPSKSASFHQTRTFRNEVFSFVRGEAVLIEGKIFNTREKPMGILYKDNKELINHSNQMVLLEPEGVESTTIVLKGTLLQDANVKEYYLITIDQKNRWIRYRFLVQMKEKTPKVESIEYWQSKGTKSPHLILPNFDNGMAEEEVIRVALKGKYLEELTTVQLNSKLPLKFERKDEAEGTYIYRSSLWNYKDFRTLHPQDISLHYGNQKSIPMKKVRSDASIGFKSIIANQTSDGVSSFTFPIELNNVLSRVNLKVSNLNGKNYIQEFQGLLPVINGTVNLQLNYNEGQKPPSLQTFNFQIIVDNLIKNTKGNIVSKTIDVEVKVEDKNAKIVTTTNGEFVPGRSVRFSLEPVGALTFPSVAVGSIVHFHVETDSFPAVVEIFDEDRISFKFEVPELDNDEVYGLRGSTFSTTIGSDVFRGDLPNFIGFPEWVEDPSDDTEVFTGETIEFHLRTSEHVQEVGKLLTIKPQERYYQIIDSSFADDQKGSVKINRNAPDTIPILFKIYDDVVDTLHFYKKDRKSLIGRFTMEYQKNKKRKPIKVDLEKNMNIGYRRETDDLIIELTDDLHLDPFEVSDIYLQIKKVDGTTIKERVSLDDKELRIDITNLGVDPGNRFNATIFNGNQRLDFSAKEKQVWWAPIDIRSGISAASQFRGGLELSNSDTTLVSSTWNYLDGIMIGAFYPIWKNNRNKEILSLGLTFGVQTASDKYESQRITETTTFIESDGVIVEETVIGTTSLEKTVTNSFARASISLLVFKNLYIGYAFGGKKSGGLTLGVSASLLDVSKFITGSD